MKCSKCGKDIPTDTPASDNWQYYCAECGFEEAMKEIRESNKYYGFEKQEHK